MKNDRPGSADEIRHDLKLALQWRGDLKFEAGKEGAPTILMDGDSKDGPSPPETLLSALAACTAVDVVLILEKRRTKPRALEVAIRAERADGQPRRVTKVHLAYRITGTGIDRAQAERAIELAVTKYCTVRDSMDPEMPVLWSLELVEG
jgi:putative redox protein